jgi:hypothetical protein
MADFDRNDGRCPTLQQTVRKAARRGANVEADRVSGIYPELLQRRFELDTAASHVRQSFAGYDDLRIFLHTLARLLGHASADRHKPRANEHLRPFSARGQSQLHYPFVETLCQAFSILTK